MKALLALFLTTCSLFASAQFGPVNYLPSNSGGFTFQIACFDMEGDGQTDVLSSDAQFPQDFLHLIHNQGNGNFTDSIIPSNTIAEIRSFAFGDLDQDGLQDFVLVHGFDAALEWHENTGSGFIPHTIDTALGLCGRILLADFDNDGRLDIYSQQEDRLALYYALPAGGFGPRQTIVSGTEYYAIEYADFNNDGYLDLCYSSFGFSILLGDGMGGFTNHSSTGGTAIFLGLEAGDLDGDGDQDLSVYHNLNGIKFYENDGTGTLSLKGPILTANDNYQQMEVVDLDCDGLVDVATTRRQANQIIWMRNNGGGSFSPPIVVHTEPGQLVAAITTYDFDGDGAPDILWGNDSIGLHLNQCFAVGLDPAPSTRISIYPNPSSGLFRIHNPSGEAAHLQVRNALGQMLLRQDIAPYAHESISLPGAGIFFLQIQQGKTTTTQKLVKE